MSGAPAHAAAAGSASTSSVRLRRRLAGALALAWAALVFWLSSRPDPLPFSLAGALGVDKLVHGAGYAVLGALLVLATAGARRSVRRAVVIAVALASLYGVTDELHQSFVPGRDTSAGDWAADTVGALAGAALAAAVLRRRGGGA